MKTPSEVPLRAPREFRVRLNGVTTCITDWPVMAQAAWDRAARNREAAQHGGSAELYEDGICVARVQPETLRGHAWPLRNHPQTDLRDVVKALLQLLREDEWDAKEIAEAMTEYGLTTTRSRIDALRGSTPGKRAEVTEAELVVMIKSVINRYKQRSAATSG